MADTELFKGHRPPKLYSNRPLADAAILRPKQTAVVLDMGEESREQGFRLNGCR